MKRSGLMIVHVLAVLLFAAGLSVLYIGSPNGYGISWVTEEAYEDTPQFALRVNEDLANVKRYAVLRDAFEENGEIAYEKSVVQADTTNGRTSYSLRYLTQVAQKFGCTMDAETHKISIASGIEESNNYELKISYKTYDPYYYENLPVGPGQGIMTLKDLSYEVMQAFAEYYELRGIYGEEDGNFYYSMHYMDESGSYQDLANTDKTVEEFRNLGKYVIAEGRGQSVDTNISPTPEQIQNTGGDYSPVLEEEYVFAAGVDINYPYSDRYQKAAASFEGDVTIAYAAVAALVAGALLMVITLIPILRFDGADGDRALLNHPSDKLPYELYLAIGVFLAWAVGAAAQQTVFKVVKILAPESQWNYWSALIRMCVLYGAFVLLLIGSARRYRNSTGFSNTLLARFFQALDALFSHGSVAWRLLSRYAVFTVGNLCAAFVLVWFYYLSADGGRWLFAFAGMLILTVLADCLVFWAMFRHARQRELLAEALQQISEGETSYEVQEGAFSGDELGMAKSINHISIGLREALNEQVKSERLKADLITNVSHDIKTPLTSIINYVDLIKREDIQNPRVREYIEVLDKKSARLKNLTEDLLEASKASSGNVKLEMQKIDLVELAMQAGAEFDDKFHARSLELCLTVPETPVYIMADGRHLWRVLENLYNNAAKYAMEHTRIYADVVQETEQCVFTIKNISADKLNISPDELTERFVRGDVSRSTEGSGLGLSIATSLTKLMGGRLEIVIDGDLYKANIIFLSYQSALETEKERAGQPGSLIEIIG